MDMSGYKDLFKTEAEEHLQQLNNSLLALEKTPDNLEHINIMFRSAHTLKGMSATMGFTNIADLTHEMENLMDSIRNNVIRLEESTIDILFECVDALETLIENVDGDGEIDISQLHNKIKSIVDGKSPKLADIEESESSQTEICSVKDNEILIDIEFSDKEESEITASQQNGKDVVVARICLDESCILKAARSALVLRRISEVGGIIKTIPSQEDLEDENFDKDFYVVFSTSNDNESIKKNIESVSEIKSVSLLKLEPKEESLQDGKERIDVEDTNAMASPEATFKRSESIKNVQSVRVDIERLDNLMNLVGELIISKIRLNQLATDLGAKNLEEVLVNLDRLTNEIQTNIMEARMVPIDQIFRRFPRMLRDLAKSEGKQLNLVIEGSEIELDRTVLDEIGDPLVHLLRNAVDHGIETKEERAKIGKPEAGLIRLAASRQRNNVVIEVEDDGKGMDPEHLREVAVKKEIMNKVDADKLSDQDALNLIFMPGFSGAATITDISGRGVGMDVVKTEIEKLGGTIKVESITGKGSKIILQLPLTVAIIQSLMIKIEDETYAIPLTNVVRDVGIKKSDIKTIEGEEVIMLRGKVLPLLRLHDVLQNPSSEDKENLIVVIVEKMGSHVGLIVDKLLGQQEVIIKTLENRLLKKTKGFAGATILGDGSVALILDIATLI